MTATFKTYPAIGDCLSDLFPEARRLYVSPAIAASASSNPYLELLYRGLSSEGIGRPVSLASRYPVLPIVDRLRGVPGVWHQHWLQCSSAPTFLRAAHRLRAAALYRRLGGHVLWTVHNLEPHVRRFAWANAWLTQGMRETAELLHVHTEEAARQLVSAWGVAPGRVVVVPHPKYDVRTMSRAAARAKLREHYGIDLGSAKTFLVFGMIARYKQVVEVIGTFTGIDPTRGRLVVAGAVRGNEQSYRSEIVEAMQGAPVHLCDRFIPDEHVAWFFGAADIVLFNYRQILTSGAVELARAFGSTIWIPNLPALEGLTGDTVERFRDLQELRERVGRSTAT